MMTTLPNPLSKRVKRHVTGRMQNFFAATAPGFEKLCFDELMSLPLSVSAKSAVIVEGGVEFRGRVHDCYLANLNLRTANRILMRIGAFKATNFDQLEKRLADLPWELFLCPGFPPKISVTARHSRLYHKDAIAERFQASISDRLAQTGLHEDIQDISFYRQQIFVRVAEDRFTVSIDSSGEILHKRGIKKHGGTAPLRETIAAAMLKFGKYNCREPLADPLCGSGTFSLEAAMMATHTPPGWLRDFAFMGWPAFRPQRWAYIKRESEKNFTRLKRPLIFASDKDKAACSRLQQCVRKYDFSGIIRVHCSDFFNFSPSELTKKTGLVVLNPPYGRRIETVEGSETFFYSICEKLGKDYKKWKVAMIVPGKSLVKTVPFRLKSHRFRHGGLNMTLLAGSIA